MEISTDTLEVFLFILLFGYIIYLQLQLTKKNNILKSVYDKIDKPNSKLKKDDIIRFLENIKNPNYSGVVTKDKLLDNKYDAILFGYNRIGFSILNSLKNSNSSLPKLFVLSSLFLPNTMIICNFGFDKCEFHGIMHYSGMYECSTCCCVQ